MFYLVSMFSTFGITLDKYISVQYSLRYNTIVSRERLVKSIVFIWFASILISMTISVPHALTRKVHVGGWIYFDILEGWKLLGIQFLYVFDVQI